MLLLTTPRFDEHTTPPGHPERPERAHVFDAVAARWREQGAQVSAPRSATRDELVRVHAAEYLDALMGLAVVPSRWTRIRSRPPSRLTLRSWLPAPQCKLRTMR